MAGPSPSRVRCDLARRGVAAAVLLGLALRVAIALCSIGTNDARILHANGRAVAATSLAQAYRDDPSLNHPPLPIVWAWIGYRLVGERVWPFSLWLKLPSIACEAASIALVGAIVAGRTGRPRAGVAAATLLALNPTSLLVVGYHANTDGALACFTLAAWWLASRGRPGLAALAMAASINTKLGPAPSAFVLLACARSRRELGRMLAGLAAGTVPFIVLRLWAGPAFFGDTLGYRPPGFSWLASIAWYARALPSPAGPLGLFLSSWHARTVTQSTLLIAAVCCWLRLRRPDRFDPLTVAGVYWSAFLFWNGGPFQYCEWPVPLFAALRPRLALHYGVAAGAFVGWAYLAVRVPGWPLESVFGHADDEVWQRALGLPLLALLAMLVSLLRHADPTAALRSSHGTDEADASDGADGPDEAHGTDEDAGPVVAR